MINSSDRDQGRKAQGVAFIKLGKYRTGKSCLHIKRLTDVDPGVLKQLIARSLKAPLPGA